MEITYDIITMDNLKDKCIVFINDKNDQRESDIILPSRNRLKIILYQDVSLHFSVEILVVKILRGRATWCDKWIH